MLKSCECRTSHFIPPLISGRQLDPEALVAAIRALEALAHERTVAKLKQETQEPGYETIDGEVFSLPYDPVSIFLLEAMVSISCHTSQYIEDTWQVACRMILTDC